VVKLLQKILRFNMTMMLLGGKILYFNANSILSTRDLQWIFINGMMKPAAFHLHLLATNDFLQA